MKQKEIRLGKDPENKTRVKIGRPESLRSLRSSDLYPKDSTKIEREQARPCQQSVQSVDRFNSCSNAGARPWPAAERSQRSAAQNIDKKFQKRTSYPTSPKTFFFLEVSDNSLAALEEGSLATVSALAPHAVDVGALALFLSIELDLNVEVELGSASGRVLEDRDVGVAIFSLANTKDNRRPITGILTLGAVPDTSILNAVALLVDVVLSGGAAAVPVVVLLLVRVANADGAASLGNSGDNHVLGSGVISSAGDNILVKIVLDGDTSHSGLAEGLVTVTGQLKLAVLVAVEATNGLLGSTLSGGPLAIAVDGSVDLRDDLGGEGEVRDILNARPPVHSEPLKGNSTVLGREGVAVEYTTLEGLVDTSASAVETRAGTSSLGLGSLGCGGLRSLGGLGDGSLVDRLGDGGRDLNSLGLVELGADLLLGLSDLLRNSGSSHGGNGGSVGGVRLANNDEVASVETSLGVLDVDLLSAELVDGLSGGDNVLGDNVRLALLNLGTSVAAGVHVLVLVVLSGGTGGKRGRQSVSDEVLHGGGTKMSIYKYG
ncbi:hypothetical protein HG530_012895 [Fusarium avenaceum]|nr:hypothetical protein HG530_012895 [Fusarium avenaceum]